MLNKSGPCLQKDIELQLVLGDGLESGFVTPIFLKSGSSG